MILFLNVLTAQMSLAQNKIYFAKKMSRSISCNIIETLSFVQKLIFNCAKLVLTSCSYASFCYAGASSEDL